ncbi:hypothetical protein GCM10027048_00910 [Hymenobacter coalescens]
MTQQPTAWLGAFLCLGFLGAAPPTDVPKTSGEAAPSAKKPAASPARKPAAARKVPTANGVSGAAAAFMASHNLTPWWQELNRNQPESHGFVGADYYRLDVVLLSVQRDAQLVNVYHVRGKQRFKGRISAFAGRFTLDEVAEKTLTRTRNNVRETQTIATAFTGRFRFQLAPASRGVLVGDVTVDLRPQPFPAGDPRPTGFTFDGEWHQPDGQYRPVAWSDDVFSLGKALLGDFEIGSRSPDINPRYYHAGWDTYWENDEWWTAARGRRR